MSGNSSAAQVASKEVQYVVYIVPKVNDEGINKIFFQIHKNKKGERRWQLPALKIMPSSDHLKKAKEASLLKIGIDFDINKFNPITLRNVMDIETDYNQKVFVYSIDICSISDIKNNLLPEKLFPFTKKEILEVKGKIPLSPITKAILEKNIFFG